MSAEVVVLAVHGMGETKTSFADGLERELIKQLGVDWTKIHFDRVFYQDILQKNQTALFKRVQAKAPLDSIRLRQFLLYGFSDAAGLERNASAPNSPYELAQKRILERLDFAFDFIGSAKPVIVIAQSLGGQVMSNYLWDAQRPKTARRGVWKNASPGGVVRNSAKDKFRRLKSMRFLYTTGCNIPIFVAGFPEASIKAVATASKGYSFSWENYYDEDDALGWPLKNLSKSYGKAVHKDYAINAGSIFSSWNPLSHLAYWEDRDVVDPLVRDIRKLLP